MSITKDNKDLKAQVDEILKEQETAREKEVAEAVGQCKECGIPFQQIKKWQRFCDPVCRNAWHGRRLLARHFE